MSGITHQLASFIASADTCPAETLPIARLGFCDCIAVMIAGAGEAPVSILASMARETSGPDSAPQIPGGRLLSPSDAALVNGTAAHVLDFDDVAIDGHPSVVLVPAILAEGHALGTSGVQALEAYVFGYETWAAVMELESGHLHDRGFHPTAILGTLATAAACARLHRLDTDRTVHALGIAASLASGLVANFGTMTKSLHAGRTAQNGVLAARLAKAGFTASPDAIEHKAGLLFAHSPTGRISVETDLELGRRWRLAEKGLNVKRYPICYAAHRSVDAMLELAQAHGLQPDDIEKIHVRIGETQQAMLRNHAPTNGLEAKFSIEFALASALVARKVGLRQLDDAFVQSSDIVSTMRKVHCTTTSEVMKDLPFAPADEISIDLPGNGTLSHDPVSDAKGSWANPLSSAEMQDKFMDCVEVALGEDQTLTLFESLMDLQHSPTIRELPVFAPEHRFQNKEYLHE
ncbi:MAG: MmgE/PrpD family protein [Pseudaminobacter sp.]